MNFGSHDTDAHNPRRGKYRFFRGPFCPRHGDFACSRVPSPGAHRVRRISEDLARRGGGAPTWAAEFGWHRLDSDTAYIFDPRHAGRLAAHFTSA